MEVGWSHVAVAVAAVAWALAAAAARARPRGMATKEWLQGLVIAHFPAFYHKHILPAVYGDLTASINVGQPYLRDLLPTLEAAPSLGAASFGPGDVVDAAPDAAGSRKIVATTLLPQMLEALADYETGATGKMYAAVDALVEACLPHVGDCPDGTRPTLDRCVYYCMNKERGAYFPVIHWDTDWVQFPGAAGFQLWFLARAHGRAGVGNMFMVSTPDLRPDDPSVRYVPTKGGGLAKIFHDSSAHEYPLKRFASVADAGLRFEYLAMVPGDCLIMCKRHLHMSDPRLLLDGEANDRLAVNFRVVFTEARGAGATIPFWPYHSYNLACHQRLKHRAFTDGTMDADETCHITVQRHEMLNLAWNKDWD